MSSLLILATLLAVKAPTDRCRPLIERSLAKAQVVSYPDYRLPRSSDQPEYNVSYNRKHGGTGCLGVASGDFDGDGRGDVALLLPAKARSEVLVVVALRRGSTWVLEALRKWEGSAASYYVEALPPGRYESLFWGEATPESGEVEALQSSNDGVATGQLESTQLSYFRSDGAWTFAWTSD
jgi:hypothetical protein